MSNMDTNLVYVDLYQNTPNAVTRVLRRPQKWRWRALNGNNFRVLAVSSEAYTNRGDAVDAIIELFGGTSDVFMREAEHGNQLLRQPWHSS